ncbi:hypothetical protein [Oxalobacter paraformigenes]|uniref:Uncharacterized protein n=1 Tax=Oxalobacter paraformigenes TaxID=556268 RepID=C3X3J7_9BURK|nr:hypothetical protein [Oxalobacter paraformigenes]EEO27783.1 hypothetical protein OFAG_00936 [Oxalobacter paraformigenes]
MWEAIAAMVASAALQQINNSVTSSRQNRIAQEAMKRQRDYQRQAEKIALDNANDYQQDTRADNQEKIADELTENYYKPVEAAQTVNALNATTQGNVSQDYQQAKSASDAFQQKTAHELARLLGRQNSAYRLRQNEAIKMAGNANEIARINNFARGRYDVDKYAIEAAGRPDPLLQLGSQILGMYGAASLREATKTGVTDTTGGVTKTAANGFSPGDVLASGRSLSA